MFKPLILLLLLHGAPARLRKLFAEQPPFHVSTPEPADARFVQWFSLSPVEQQIGVVIYKLLGPGGTYNSQEWQFVDVGLNRGYQSLIPARLGYSVLAIEAMPSCVAQASETLALNNLTRQVRVVTAGVAERSGGSIAFHARAACNQDNQIVDRASKSAGERLQITRGELRVPLRSLSSLLSRLSISTAVMKMDIEGSEMAALNSFGVDGFRKHRVEHLIIEVCSHVWMHSFEHGLHFFQRLAKESSVVYCLDPSEGTDLPTCAFTVTHDHRFGTLSVVTDMRKAIQRPGGRSCCGNLWFRDIGGDKRSDR